MTSAPRDPPDEWDAGIYHRVSAPQVTWGGKVLARLTLAGNAVSYTHLTLPTTPYV